MKLFIIAVLLTVTLADNAGQRQLLNREDTLFVQPCWNERNNINKYTNAGAQIFSYENINHVPKCNRHGMYSPVQCERTESGAKKCWCVTPCGEYIEGTSTQDNYPDCMRVEEGPCSTSSGSACDKNGFYKSLQCNEEDVCWCVNKCGQEIIYTRGNRDEVSCSDTMIREVVENLEEHSLAKDRCQDGSKAPVCRVNTCEHMTCPGFNNATCKVNACKGCQPEFYDELGRILTCGAKTGYCPSVMGKTKCSQFGSIPECTNDQECSGADRCCHNGCSTICRPPIMEKMGYCPLPVSIVDKTPTDRCSVDSDCGNEHKCCSNGEGHVCVPREPTNKPGTCPNKPVPSSSYAIECRGDSECRGTRKCCETSMGSSCLEPTMSDKMNGECPVAIHSPEVGVQDHKCDHDNECGFRQMCCNIGNGRKCMKMMKPATPPCQMERNMMPTTVFGGVEMPLLNRRMPTCDARGFHTPKQCNQHTGECFCVDACGNMMEKITFDGQCAPTTPPCANDLKRIVSGRSSRWGITKVQCTEDGFYAARQCDTEACWCTDRCGNELPGTRGLPISVNCDCPYGDRAWNCLMDPCNDATCPGHPEAECRPSYCGGCRAEFFSENQRINCNITRPGRCPAMVHMPQQIDSSMVQCMNDNECDANKKCCSNGLGQMICISPRTEEKPGSCPTVDPSVHMGSCSFQCSSDSMCTGPSKCCDSGCGTTCMMPQEMSTCPTREMMEQAMTQAQIECESEKEDTCMENEDCSGNGVCCEHPCGRRCMRANIAMRQLVGMMRQQQEEMARNTNTRNRMPPINLPKIHHRTAKAGSCPSMSILECVYANQCSDDSKCEGDMKCCRNPCGTVCVAPWKTMKFGECPTNDQDMSMCTAMDRLMDECSDDSDCFESKKCCMQGCNHVCMNMWRTVKVGQCPAMDMSSDCMTERSCTTDNDCMDLDKCCNTPCSGRMCRAPTSESLDSCMYQSESRIHGETWTPDPCTTCRCFAGQSQCMSLPCTPMPQGCTATPVQGQCCPTFTCPQHNNAELCLDHEGITHRHNEVWWMDPCSKCSCTNGTITCERTQCSMTMMEDLKEGCRMVEVPDSCCPEMVCEASCRDHQGHLRYENDQWYPDSCTQCKCINNQVTCTDLNSMCADLSTLAHCEVSYVEGRCCPTVICPTTESEMMSCTASNGLIYGQGSFWMSNDCTFTTCIDGAPVDLVMDCFASSREQNCQATNIQGQCCPELSCSSEQTCTMNGLTFQHGESWQQDTCTNCRCERGTSMCMTTTCPRPDPGCSAKFTQGRCCPDITCDTFEHVPMCSSPQTGVSHRDGETWMEGDCQVCSCQGGRMACTSTECPRLTMIPGCHMVRIPGLCCPQMVCRGSDDSCTFEGKTYQNGQTWTMPMTRDFINSILPWSVVMERPTCSMCQCMRGRVSCMTNACPQPRQGCFALSQMDDCSCPQISCTGKHLGTCPMPDMNNMEPYEGSFEGNSCSEDNDCPHNQLCCHNGFAHVCTKPQMEGCSDSEGRRRVDGDIWQHNDCTRCMCINGQNRCHQSRCHDVPSGCQVTEVPGACCGEITCPTASQEQTCQHEGTEYAEGSTWYIDSCTMCVCLHGDKICHNTQCPLGPEEGCRLTSVKGQCCPERICREPGMCESEYGTHMHGETFNSDPCTTCMCRDGIISCMPKQCPEPMPHCSYSQETDSMIDQCCRNITCTQGIVPRKTCMVNEEMMYDSQILIRDACTICQCMDGELTCTTATCPEISYPRGCHTVHVSGQCCPQVMCQDVNHCMDNGVEHLNGEQWTTDKCTVCRCDHGNKICSTQHCPSIRQGCQASLTPSGQCCPKVECPQSMAHMTCTEMLNDLSSMTYNDGEMWMRDSCTQCRCMRGRTQCNTMSCPTTVSPGCSSIRVPGQCCPIITCNSVKSGQCPRVNPMMYSLTHDTCLTDSDCQGTSKCCFTGIVRTCMTPMILEKPGNCPSLSMDHMMSTIMMPVNTGTGPTWTSQCSTDMDCTGNWKCCSNGQSSMLCHPPHPTRPMTPMEPMKQRMMTPNMDVTRTIMPNKMKAGSCPMVPRTNNNINNMGLFSVSHCQTDIQCPGDNKCCDSGYGLMCMQPITSVRYGSCPRIMPRHFMRMSCISPNSVDMCSSDMECGDGKKCCNTGCRLECVMPEMTDSICPAMPMNCDKVCPEGFATNKDQCEICQCKKSMDECIMKIFECKMNCEFGFATDNTGCEICRCKTPVVPLMKMMDTQTASMMCERMDSCLMTCDLGYATNSMGCEICQCRKEASQCSKMEACSAYCPFGMATNQEGCPMCMCKQPTDMAGPMCPQMTYENCELQCSNGFATDTNGCMMCKCRASDPQICQQMESCQLKCSYGMATDEYGCEICKCMIPFMCPSMSECDLTCDQFATDKFGCSKCECSLPEFCHTLTIEECSLKQTCAYGLMSSDNDCDICRCRMPTQCPADLLMGCNLNCQFGFATDTNGCETCRCRTAVSECKMPITNSNCHRVCSHGLMTDENGCELCQCQQPAMRMVSMQMMQSAMNLKQMPSMMSCPPMEACDLTCPMGFATDPLGCSICSCLMTHEVNRLCPVVNRLTCPLRDLCPWGLATEINGCEKCGQCKQPTLCTPLSPLTCDINCPHGFQTDLTGCEVCRCKQPASLCTPVTRGTCLKTCTYGYATEDGCEVCGCKQPTGIPIPVVNRPTCKPLSCDAYCPYGLATDNTGCEICQCVKNADECTAVTEEMCPAMKTCPWGLSTNSMGCPICQCKRPKTCLPINANVCDRQCQFGYTTDQNGCEVCQCRADPKDCFALEDCQKTCRFGLRTNAMGCSMCECMMPNNLMYTTVRMEVSLTCQPLDQNQCMLDCQHGMATDQYGCKICKCRRAVSECPSVDETTCPLMKWNAPYGLATNSMGCPVCMAQQPVMCMPNVCSKSCPRGFATDSQGCDICMCKVFDAHMCPMLSMANCPLMKQCKHGLATDMTGCEECRCKMPVDQGMRITTKECSPIHPETCPLTCDLGFMTDRRGCEICQCIPAERQCQELTTEICPLMTMCAWGMQVDGQGCQVCSCREPSVCKPIPNDCRIDCRYGLASDSKGCEMCQCKRSPTECPAMDLSSCQLTCPFGLATDSDLCEICACRMPPTLVAFNVTMVNYHSHLGMNSSSPRMLATPPSLFLPGLVCQSMTACTLSCLNGYSTDSNGCEVCQCQKSNSDPTCPKMDECELKMDCPYGLGTDSVGCQVCHCRQPSICSTINRMNCDLNCPYGYATTPNTGCEACRCRTAPHMCSPKRMLSCELNCEFGYVTDEKNCDICRCKVEVEKDMNNSMSSWIPRTFGLSSIIDMPLVQYTPYMWSSMPMCRPLTACNLDCPNGLLATDHAGCQICACPRDASMCPELPEEVCPQVHMCPYGLASDQNQCQICQCRQPSASCQLVNDMTCPRNCPFGYATDANGCTTCSCRRTMPNRAVSVTPFNCAKTCMFGYATDPEGFDICSCRQPTNLMMLMDDMRAMMQRMRMMTSMMGMNCPLKQCDLQCPMGYATDSQGCNTCMCKKTGQEMNQCGPMPSCSEQCILGSMFPNGCFSCDCAPLKLCNPVSPMTCELQCPHGYATDMQGCELCQCRIQDTNRLSSCQAMTGCDTFCMFGYITDSKGCEVCSCAMPGYLTPEMNMMTQQVVECQMMESCDLDCEQGLATDSNGCHVCRCMEPSDSPSCMDSQMTPDCQLINMCPFGMATDKNNCPVCQCRMPRVCPRMECSSSVCENGYATDLNGCSTCQCRRPVSECTPVENCQLTCPFGLATHPTTRCDVCMCRMLDEMMMEKMMEMQQEMLQLATERVMGMAMPSLQADMQSRMQLNQMMTMTMMMGNHNQMMMTMGNMMGNAMSPSMGVKKMGLVMNNQMASNWMVGNQMRMSISQPLFAINDGMRGARQNNMKGRGQMGVPYISDKMRNSQMMSFMNGMRPEGSECPRVRCRMYCPLGYQMSAETGCPMCMCNEMPLMTCPAVTPGEMGMCVEMCNDDDMKCGPNQMCCSNGCGRQCMDPIINQCVDERGVTRTEGAVWFRDSCSRCSCLSSGQVRCTTMECPPIPNGCQPEFQEGACCPTMVCPEMECVSMSEMWVRDQCTNCSCVNGQSHCTAMACPKMNPGCQSIYREDRCCPDMQCTGCEMPNGMVIGEGETHSMGRCTTCTCESGQRMCRTAACPTPRLGCKVNPLLEGQCCPTIECPNEMEMPCFKAMQEIPMAMVLGEMVPMLGSFVPSCDPKGYYSAVQCSSGTCWCSDHLGNEIENTRSHNNNMPVCESTQCMDNEGKMYEDGDQWMMDRCSTCTCMEGRAVCQQTQCPAAPQGCIQVMTQNSCCPQFYCGDRCYNNQGVVQSLGESWMLDSCTSCQCMKDEVLCRTQRCPPSNRMIPEDCRMVPKQGECCPTKMICDQDCPSSRVTTCLANPCDMTTCPANPEAVCRANYCGDCTALFYDEMDNIVNCEIVRPCDPNTVKVTSRKTKMIARCTPEGYYMPKQCDMNGACWCVDRSGEEMEGTFDSEGEKVMCEIENPCQAEMRTNSDLVNQGHQPTSSPMCDEEGFYMPKQCDRQQSTCWCTRRDGTEIPNSRRSQDLKDFDCEMPCFGQKSESRCSGYKDCDLTSFCHMLPDKEEGYCCMIN